jgi:hypothetical protein
MNSTRHSSFTSAGARPVTVSSGGVTRRHPLRIRANVPQKSREAEVDRSSGIPKSSRLLARARRNVETLVLRRSRPWLP